MTAAALTPIDLKRRIAAAGHGVEPPPHAPLVVDLRAQRSFRRRHIPGSHNIPKARLLSTELPARDLILISDHGELDLAVATHLHEGGFHRRIEHLQGGLEAWNQAGLPLAGTAREGDARPSPLGNSLREPWLLSLLLLALAITLQQGTSPLVLSAALLWGALAALSLLLQRSSRQVLRRCP